MNIRRSLAVAGVALCAIGLGVESQAWACSPHPGTLNVQQITAPPGEFITVTGSSFVTSGVVELQWDSDTGPVLAQAMGPSFSVTFVVPQVAPGRGPLQNGDYGINVVAWDTTGARTEDSVLTDVTVTNGVPDDVPSASQPASQQQASSLVGVVSSPTAAPAPASIAVTSNQASPSATTPAPAPAARVAAPAATVAPAASVAAPAATVAPGANIPAASHAVSPTRDSSQDRSLTQSVWGGAASGFKSGQILPSLANVAPSAQPASGSSMFGIGLLVAGSLVIVGGGVVVAVARRRARAIAS